MRVRLSREDGAEGAPEAGGAGGSPVVVAVRSEVGEEISQLAKRERAGPPPVPDPTEDGVVAGQAGHAPFVVAEGERPFWSRLGTKPDASPKGDAGSTTRHARDAS